MAVVYLAHDTELGRAVAIKLLADHLVNDESFRTRFLREARMAARLSHPNIVQVFDFGEQAGRPFIVMEYVRGETLADSARRDGRMAPSRVAQVARECCAGLACAHAAGLIHRDIKPENLLIHADGTVKIADFGVARATGETQLTQVGSIVGTARYLAPEQAQPGEDVTPAADMYALGVVLYELLTGRPPHDGASLTDLLIAKRVQPVRPIRELEPRVAPGLDANICSCLAYAAHERPSAGSLARALDDIDATTVAANPGRATTRVLPVAHTPTPQRTTVATYASRTGGARRRRVLGAALAAAVALAVGLTLVAGGVGGHRAEPTPPRAPTGATSAQLAHHLADWIRGHTR
jgi:serine/threonine-protein kinase